MSSHCYKSSMYHRTAGYSNSYCTTLRATLVPGGSQLASQVPEYVVILLSCPQSSSECRSQPLQTIVLIIVLHPVVLMVMTAPVASASLLEILRYFCHTSDDSTDVSAEFIDSTALHGLNSLCQLWACAVFATGTEPVMWLNTRLPGSLLLLCKRFCKRLYMLSKIHWASECTVGKASMILRTLACNLPK